MLERVNRENKTDILLELDGANGVLGTLASGSYKKFYTIQNCLNTCLNTRLNLEHHGLVENDYFKLHNNLTKSYRNLKSIIDENDQNSRISFVFQDFKQPMLAYQKKYSKIPKNLFSGFKSFFLKKNFSCKEKNF